MNDDDRPNAPLVDMATVFRLTASRVPCRCLFTSDASNFS